MSTIVRAFLFGLLTTGFTAVQAFPIASGGDGLSVLVAGTDPIVATYQGNSAFYSNDLYLMLDAGGEPGDDGDPSNDLFLFNNHASAVGSSVDLGGFTPGTELIFRLHVNNTGYDFFTGAASRNPDGYVHARVQENWLPSESLVSFEDWYAGRFDFNDLSFSFTNTVTTPPTAALEPGMLGLLSVGLGAFGWQRRRAARLLRAA